MSVDMGGEGILCFFVAERFRCSNPRASLLTSSIVCAYATYLIWSALFSEPDCEAVASESACCVVWAFFTQSSRDCVI